MKISYVCAINLKKDSGAQHVLEIVSNMTLLGHEVALFAGGFPDKATIYDTIKLPTGKFTRLRSIFLGIFSFWTLYQNWYRTKPDVIYVRFQKLLVSPYILSKIFRIPLVVELNTSARLENLADKSNKLTQILAEKSEKFACIVAKHIIVVSEGIAKEIRLVHNLPPEKITVLSNGVNLDVFKPYDSHKARSILGLEQEVSYIAYVGTFQPWQGLDTLLDAYNLIVNKKQNIRLLLVGDGPKRNELFQKIETLELQDNILTPGWVSTEESVLYIGAADVCILTTTIPSGSEGVKPIISRGDHFYGSPLKARGYMACARPVVATYFAETGVLVEENKAGIAVPPEDPKALEKAINFVLENPALGQKMGVAGREAAVAKFSWHYVAEKTIKVCQRVQT